MSNPKIATRANPSQFRFATTHRTEDGFEFVIIAKSRDELSTAWRMVAGPSPFDSTKIDRVEIKKSWSI